MGTALHLVSRSMQKTNACRHGFAATLIFCLLSVFPAASVRAAPQAIPVGHILRGHFQQDRRLAGFSQPLRTEGSFLLVPGRGLIWFGEKPFANTTVITSAGILQLANGQEAMRLPASQLPGLSHLYEVLGAALTGNIDPLRQTFAITESSQTAQWQLVLKPLHPDSPAMSQLKSLTLSGGHFVETVEIDKGGGDVDRISFLDQTETAADLSANEKALLGKLGK
jgi:Outer membrane lipoprotein carrier protein LolA-like